ncbi:MAG TPA: hypothetical protein VGY54_04500, partial [Polyangiaceae bacterium]|nr:hypothetical protein [Polyangiaceae bacterium]
MFRRISGKAVAWTTLFLLLNTSALGQPSFSDPNRYHPSAEEQASLRDGIKGLETAIASLERRLREATATPAHEDLKADVGVYLKAGRWVTRFGEFFLQNDVRNTLQVLAQGLERARELEAGEHPWTSAEGSSIRGYVSRVDGSVQPYALILPKGYKPDQPARLDVVLHGRGATLTEASFIHAHDGKPAPADQEGLVLHVFGRTNNAYRWAGETDVFEAIEAVQRRYPIDVNRIVLRGFSMGGAGAWHIGLHHPSLWCSVEAGAGFTETKAYIKRNSFPPHEEHGLHIYDAVDYAANAFNLPMAGYGGEVDPQLQASRNIVEALEHLGYTMDRQGLITRAKGIEFLQKVGAGMGHKVDPASALFLKQFHDQHAEKGRDTNPSALRFVTCTLKYNRAAWLTVEALDAHYERATVNGAVTNGEFKVDAQNVRVLAIDPRVAKSVRFADDVFSLQSEGGGPALFVRTGARWKPLAGADARAFLQNTE